MIIISGNVFQEKTIENNNENIEKITSIFILAFIFLLVLHNDISKSEYIVLQYQILN